MKLTLITAILVVLLAMAGATAALAGGPVITPEEAPIADVRPQGDGGSWVVPTVAGLVILCLIVCGGGDDAVIAAPEACNGDENCRK